MRLFEVTLYKLKMMLADKVFFVAAVVLPVLIALLAGYAMRDEKLNIIPVAVVDEDKTSYSKLLMDRISKKNKLEIEYTSRKDALELLEGKKVEHVIVIKEGFEEKVKTGDSGKLVEFIESSSSYTLGYVREVLAGEIIRFVTNNLAAEWVVNQYKELNITVKNDLMQEAIDYADSQWEPEPLMTVEYIEAGDAERKPTTVVFMPIAASSTGIIIFFIMLYILFNSGWIIEERINGTLKRLAAGPKALAYSFFANVLALLFSAMFQVALFSIIMSLLFGVFIFTGVLSYLIISAYILSVVSISMFLSSILKTPAQLQAGAPAFALLTSFLGGCFWNFAEVPERLKMLSRLTPQGWALEGINSLTLGLADTSQVVLPIFVLFIVALILLPLSYIILYNNVKH